MVNPELLEEQMINDINENCTDEPDDVKESNDVKEKVVKSKESKKEIVKAEKIVNCIVLFPIRMKNKNGEYVVYPVGKKLSLNSEKYNELKKKELVKKV